MDKKKKEKKKERIHGWFPSSVFCEGSTGKGA